MGRGYATYWSSAGSSLCVLLTVLFSLVLREIEEEDSLWHQKNSKSESSQKQSQTSEAQEKDSVAPTTANLGDQGKIQSTRKTNFF